MSERPSDGGSPVGKHDAPAGGIILVQIDGLSYEEMKRAVDNGKLPFLESLVQSGSHRLIHYYSGVPSTTPSVQGELLYGVRQAVPAFSFVHRPSGALGRMYQPGFVKQVEEQLRKESSGGLLRGGSGYCMIYTGAAEKTCFSPASLGSAASGAPHRTWRLTLALLRRPKSILRIVALLILEFGLAVSDFLRGVASGGEFAQELRFIPVRVGICILLRELIVIGASADAAAGLPIVATNFLGYDEQAHRRGPSSLFAHWTLKGIDDAVERIWSKALRSERPYELWVYSDHGQERTVSFRSRHGRSLEDAVREILAGVGVSREGSEEGGIQRQRWRWVHGDGSRNGAPERNDTPHDVRISSLGPVAHIYFRERVSWQLLQECAKELAVRWEVPIIMYRRNESVVAITPDGEYLLPKDGGKVLGLDHPFLEEAVDDLTSLVQHPDAGHLVLSGWRRAKRPLSFAVESGSHAGPGGHETSAFLLVPSRRQELFRLEDIESLRPLDIRVAIQRLRGFPPDASPRRSSSRPARGGELTLNRIRIMSYNVRSCRNSREGVSIDRIAEIVAAAQPDVVALQELDKGTARSAYQDQVAQLGTALRMHAQFLPTLPHTGGSYGIGMLSRFPYRRVEGNILPGRRASRLREPRGALLTEIDVGGQTLLVLNTHLSLFVQEQILQARAILNSVDDTLRRFPVPFVLCGDFNAVPGSPAYRLFATRLLDAAMSYPESAGPTWPSRFPFRRIDHIFVNDACTVLSVARVDTRRARNASDHLPVIAEIELPRM